MAAKKKSVLVLDPQAPIPRAPARRKAKSPAPLTQEEQVLQTADVAVELVRAATVIAIAVVRLREVWKR